MPDERALDRFLAKVAHPLGLLCWEWLGARTAGGYGCFHLGGRVVYAHRFIYEQLHGRIPFGDEIDHTCGNRACVAPHHLEAVIHIENVQRAWARRKAAA